MLQPCFDGFYVGSDCFPILVILCCGFFCKSDLLEASPIPSILTLLCALKDHIPSGNSIFNIIKSVDLQQF